MIGTEIFNEYNKESTAIIMLCSDFLLHVLEIIVLNVI